MPPFDLRDFAISADPITPIPTHRRGERFIRGPIPFDWFVVASRLPGCALQVALVIWFYAGIAGHGTVTVSLSGMDVIGVGRPTASRALKALQRVGLVRVDRRPGRKVLVTLLDAPRTDTSAAGDMK